MTIVLEPAGYLILEEAALEVGGAHEARVAWAGALCPACPERAAAADDS
jgi:hypothetical protein